MAEPQEDLTKDALKQQQLKERNEALGLPSDFDPNTILNSKPEYNYTPHSTIAKQQVIGNPITGPNPGKNGIVKIDGKKVILDNSEYTTGVRQAISGSVDSANNPYKLMQPYSYNSDYDGLNFKKYYNNRNFDKLGFSPYRDNDALYNQNSTFGDEMSRAWSSWGNLVATGFKSGVSYWGDLFTGGSPLGVDLKTARSMQRYMAQGSSTKGGATSFFVNNFVNSGYSIGVGLEWLGEEWALASVTGASLGLAAPETLPAMSASATKAGKLIFGGFGLGQTFKRGAVGLEQYNKLRKINDMRTFWNSTRTGKVLSAAGRTINPLGNTMSALKGVKYATKEYKLFAGVHTFGEFAKDMLQIKAAATEAKLEGGLVVLDAEKKMIDEYRATHDGLEPPPDERNKIRSIAMAEGIRDSYWNMPIIMMSNRFMYETLFKHIKPGKLKLNDAIIDETGAFTVFDKGAFKAFKGTVGERIKLAGKALIKPRTYGKFIKNYLQANLAEGLQENFQETFSGAAIDNALEIYNSGDMGAYHSFAGNVFTNFGKQFSAQGAETFLSGVLMGAISSPIMGGVPLLAKTVNNQLINRGEYKAYKEQRYNELKKTADYLNDFYKNVGSFFSPEMRNAVAQGKIAADFYEAHNIGDLKGIKDAQHAARIEAVYRALRTGNYDTMVDKFKEMKNLSDKELEEAFKLEEGLGSKARGMIDSFVERANKIKERYEYVNEVMPQVYDYTIYKEGTEARQAMELAYTGLEDAKRALIFGYASYDRNIERIQDMVNAISTGSKPLAKVAAIEFTNLMDPGALVQELALLESEIDTMSQSEDTLDKESAKELAYKRKKKEKLEKFAIAMGNAEYSYDKDVFEERKKSLLEKGFDVDKASVKRDEYGNYEKGTLVHNISKDIAEDGVAFIVDSDTTGYLLSNGDFVERNEIEPVTVEYLRDLAQVDNSAAAKDAYREYLTFLADENSDFVMNDKLDESFDLILDWRAKNKENINLVKYINYLNDPRAMLGVATRLTKAYGKLYKEKRNLIINGMSKAIKTYEFNNGIQDLYKDGWFVDEQDFKNLVNALKTGAKEMPVPKAFIKVVTGQVFAEGTPEYQKALETWNKRLPAIVESFKDWIKQQEEAAAAKPAEKKLHTVQQTPEGFAVISPEGNMVGEPYDSKETAQKVADNLNEVFEEEVEEEPVSEVVTNDMTYDQYPDALKQRLEPLFQQYLKDNDIDPAEVTDELRNNWLESITASRVINEWNAETRKKEMEDRLLGKRRKEAEPPLLRTVPLPKGKTLNDYNLSELNDILNDLKGKQKAQSSPELEQDIKALTDYIGVRNKLATKIPATEEQRKALAKLEELQNYVSNKREEKKAYLINNVAYNRVTNLVALFMDDIYNVQRQPFYNVEQKNELNRLIDDVVAEKGTTEDFIKAVKSTAINGVMFGVINQRKLDLIEDYLNKNGFTKQNVLDAFNEYGNDHTITRGNRIDTHIREFFEEGVLGPRPSYFSEKAWQDLESMLNKFRDKIVELGFVVVARDLTTFDEENLVAGTLDLLLIDRKGNYFIYDVKTGNKRKWEKYEKPEGSLPNSMSMVENTLQLSMYKRLLQNQTGINVQGLGILPIEVEADLDGNITAVSPGKLDSKGKLKTIPITYEPRVEDLIPAREAKIPAVKTEELESKPATTLETAEARIKRLNGQIEGLKNLKGRLDNRTREIERDLDKESDELEKSRKEILDLQTFVDKASPKELKGKKRKIQAEIKRLKERVTQLENNRTVLNNLKTKIANTIKNFSVLENTLLDAIDEVPKAEMDKVTMEKKSIKEEIINAINELKGVYDQKALEVKTMIDTVEDRILSISVALEKLGVTDELINLYLSNDLNVEYLRSKIAEGKLSEADTKIYTTLLNNLTKNKEFRDNFKSLTRELSKNYIERARLQFEHDQLIKESMGETSMEGVTNRMSNLRQSLLGLEQALAIINAEAKKAKEPAPKVEVQQKKKQQTQPTPTAPEGKPETKQEVSRDVVLKEAQDYVGKKYQSTRGQYQGVVYVITDAFIDKTGNVMLTMLRLSDNQAVNNPFNNLKKAMSGDDPLLVQYFDETEEAPGDISDLSYGAPSKGYVDFTDNSPEQIIEGNKKLSSRMFNMESGRYTIQRIQKKKITPTDINITLTSLGEAMVNREGVVPEVRVKGNHVDTLKAMDIPSTYSQTSNETIIEADAYARAEGFEDWSDFEKKNKDSKAFINGTQPRFIFTVEPIKIAEEVKPETDVRVRERKAAEIKQLKKVLPVDVINKLTDAEFEQALEFTEPIEARELLVKYRVPKRKEVITLEKAKEAIDNAGAIPALKELYIELEKEASLGNLENAEEVDAYYQEVLASKMMNPVAGSLEVGNLVEINGEVFKVTSIGKKVGFKQVNGTEKMSIKPEQVPTTVTRIIDPNQEVVEPTTELNKDEQASVSNTINGAASEDAEQAQKEIERGEGYKGTNPFNTYKKKPC